MNQTSSEQSFAIHQLVEGFGLLFYLVNPVKSSFEKLEDCPDYVNQVSDITASPSNLISPHQAIPFIVLMIGLEAGINHFSPIP